MSDILSTPAPSESQQIAELTRKLHWAELKIQVLEERLRLQRIEKYGPGSEKLGNARLELLELEPGASSAGVQAESERPAPRFTSLSVARRSGNRSETRGTRCS